MRRSARSALFAARFRENAARALLLPRRRPGQRTPLWQLRQRAADLLAVASRYGSFPIILETYRECLQDVFDLPALREVLGGDRAARDPGGQRRDTDGLTVRARRCCSTTSRNYMYEGDAPLAERRAQALALDRELLARAAGRGGAARAARPGRPGRARAGAAGAGRRAPGADGRRGARPAAAAGRPAAPMRWPPVRPRRRSRSRRRGAG